MHIEIIHRHMQFSKHKDRSKKASTDSVCPREHFKDKPVDVSLQQDRQDAERNGSNPRKKKEYVENEWVSGKSEVR